MKQDYQAALFAADNRLTAATAAADQRLKNAAVATDKCLEDSNNHHERLIKLLVTKFLSESSLETS